MLNGYFFIQLVDIYIWTWMAHSGQTDFSVVTLRNGYQIGRSRRFSGSLFQDDRDHPENGFGPDQ
jgi:hypothetical protein